MITYEDFINEIIDHIPKIKIGMKFEVINSFFPDQNIHADIKNITENNKKFTKPLALSAKDKIKIRKRHNNILNDFLNFKKIKKEKGDILLVVEVKDNYALCENISRPKDTNSKYFNNEELKYVKITFVDILEGNLKEIKRVRI